MSKLTQMSYALVTYSSMILVSSPFLLFFPRGRLARGLLKVSKNPDPHKVGMNKGGGNATQTDGCVLQSLAVGNAGDIGGIDAGILISWMGGNHIHD